MAVLGLCRRAGFSPIAASGGYSLVGDSRASCCSDFSYHGGQAVGHARFGSWGPWALEHRCESCGSPAKSFPGVWDLPRHGIEARPPALACGFFTTEPSRKPQTTRFFKIIYLFAFVWS